MIDTGLITWASHTEMRIRGTVSQSPVEDEEGEGDIQMIENPVSIIT